MKTLDLGNGAFQHRVGGAGVSFNRTNELDQSRSKWLETEIWTVNFRLNHDPNVANSLDTKIAALDTALLNAFTEVKLINEDGSDSAHKIANAIGGVRCIQRPSYPRFNDGDGGAWRSGSYVLEALIPLYTSDTQVINHQETIQKVESGATYGILQGNVNDAVYQRVNEKHHSILSQSGTITWAADWGTVPGPKSNVGQLGPVRITQQSARKVGKGALEKRYGHTLSYEYQFAWPDTLTGEPV